MAPFHYLGNTSIFHFGWLVKNRDFHKLKQLLKHGKKLKLRLAIAPSEDAPPFVFVFQLQAFIGLKIP